MSRIVLATALFAGISYIGSWFLDLTPAASLAWKGAGVGLLAAYAALNAKSLDGWLLVGVMAFGALGDVLLGSHGLVFGAVAFLIGHLIAIGLYLRNRRPGLGGGDSAVAAALVVVTIGVAYLLPPDRSGAAQIALYASSLAVMAAAAFISRFPRALVFAGAAMFVVSDLLIFLRTGRPALEILPIALGVWGLYFGGQVLITLGVTRTLSTPRA